jgi:hypothetical protein
VHDTECIFTPCRKYTNSQYRWETLPSRAVFDNAHCVEHVAGSRDGIGMLDADSPIWASDHLGLVVSIAFQKSRCYFSDAK